MQAFLRQTFMQKPRFSWQGLMDLLLIAVGALFQALAVRLFLVPANIASGGISGIAQIIHYYTGFPIGLMIFLGNVPLFLLGWRYLGGPRFALRTAFAVICVAVLIDLLAYVVPPQGLTSDMVLNTLYGGVVSGIGFGLVYRGQGTSGGSDILARVLNHWRGISISQSYMITDSLVMFLAGLSFSWTNALYALVSLYVSGIAAEAATEGSNVVRTAVIITANPDPVVQHVLESMERGITLLDGRGGFTGAGRTVLYCVVTRSEVAQIKALVREVDPKAFIVIGHAAEVLGEGFRSLQDK